MANERKLRKILKELLNYCEKEGCLGYHNFPIKHKVISFSIENEKS